MCGRITRTNPREAIAKEFRVARFAEVDWHPRYTVAPNHHGTGRTVVIAGHPPHAPDEHERCSASEPSHQAAMLNCMEAPTIRGTRKRSRAITSPL
jgi:hypothetical protein